MYNIEDGVVGRYLLFGMTQSRPYANAREKQSEQKSVSRVHEIIILVSVTVELAEILRATVKTEHTVLSR